MIFRVLTILIFFCILPLVFAPCSKDNDNNVVDDGDDNENNGEEDYYANTAILKGTLSIDEINKIVPPTTPLPNDITVESILTRSDIIQRSDLLSRNDFVYKIELPDSTSTDLADDQTFDLPVPVGYEFISLVKIEGDIVGLIKFKKGDKYVANVTLSGDTESQFKGLKKELSTEYIIGNITWSDDFFVAENSIYDIAKTEVDDEELSIGTEEENKGAVQALDFVAGNEKSVTISVSVTEQIVFNMLNLPEFCTFTDNGDNSSTILCKPEETDIGTYHGIFLTAITESKIGYLELLIDVSNIQISAGANFTCFLFGGNVKCWGDNCDGQLGIGNAEQGCSSVIDTITDRDWIDLGNKGNVKSICTGFSHSCALFNDGELKCWGYNDKGQLGIGDTEIRGDEIKDMDDNLPAISLGTGRFAIDIACGQYHSCAILDDYTLKCWGNNEYGQLGIGDKDNRGDESDEMGDTLSTVNLGSQVKAVSCGLSHTCAILDDNSLKCWGRNNYGQLGIGDTSDRGDDANEMSEELPKISLGDGRNALSILAAVDNSCAILDDYTLKCWGFIYDYWNNGGFLYLGSQPSDMGNTLNSINLGTDKTVKSIDSGDSFFCTILLDNSLKCWGENGLGQLGLGDTTDRMFTEQMGDSLNYVNLGENTNVKSITVGIFHTCALLDNNTVKCWGSNGSGELGYISGEDYIIGDEPNEVGDNLQIVEFGIE